MQALFDVFDSQHGVVETVLVFVWDRAVEEEGGDLDEFDPVAVGVEDEGEVLHSALV